MTNSVITRLIQVCIPVGCVSPAYCPYFPACTAPRGGGLLLGGGAVCSQGGEGVCSGGGRAVSVTHSLKKKLNALSIG